MKTIEPRAAKALVRAHERYGETLGLLKYVPSATGSIYRQAKKIYEAPYEVKGCVARMPQEHIIGRTGEDSERKAEVTITVKHLVDVFGRSTALDKMITTSDLLVFDNRVWRIVQASLSARVGEDPLLMYILLREKLGAKESDYGSN